MNPIDLKPLLIGRTICLRALQRTDFEELYLAASDPEVWELHHDSSRYYEWNPQMKEIAIGYTFIERQHWGTGTNRELKVLMLNHIYQWATVVWFHVGENDMRSRRAIEKLGAKLSHEEERQLQGKPFTQLYYKLASSDCCT